MIKKIFYTLFIVFTCFIGLNKVSAESTNYFGGGNYLNYANNGWYQLNYYDSLYYGSAHNLALDLKGTDTYDVTEIPNYVVVKFCSWGTISGYTFNTMYQSMSIEQTSSQCNFYGSDIKGKTNYAILETKPSSIISDRCNVNGYNCTLDYFNFAIRFSTATDFRLMSLSFYDSLPSIDNSTGALIDQNNTIINQNQSIINNQNNINNNLSQSNQKLDESINEQKEINKNLTDDDTSESSSEYGDFFTGFSTNNHGLTGIITAPLELIGNIAGSTCSPLPLQVPFVNKTFSLPCMSTIYKKHFGNFFTVYQTATFGLISYWVMVKLFALIKGFKNPANDEIEVMDL